MSHQPHHHEHQHRQRRHEDRHLHPQQHQKQRHHQDQHHVPHHRQPQHHNFTPAVDGPHDSSTPSPVCTLSQTPSRIPGALAGGLCPPARASGEALLPHFNRWAGGQRVTLDQAPQHYNSTPAVDGLHDSSRASPFCALSQTPSHILGALAGGVCALRKPGRGETLRDPSSGQTASLGAFRESEGKPGQGETLHDPSSGQNASLMAFREGVAQTRSRRNLALRSKCIPGCV